MSAVLRAGGNSTGPEFCTVASPIPTTWDDCGALSFQLAERLSFKIQVLGGNRAVPGTQKA